MTLSLLTKRSGPFSKDSFFSRLKAAQVQHKQPADMVCPHSNDFIDSNMTAIVAAAIDSNDK